MINTPPMARCGGARPGRSDASGAPHPPTIHIHHERVDRWLKKGPLRRCDLLVLDPPRTGAGQEVMERAAALRPRAIAYVACDPAALARDIATARQLGWDMTALRAFDLFPMTHHVECVALLEPRDSLAS